MREDIETYEPLPKEVLLPDSAFRDGAIRVVFKDKSWIRVYRSKYGGVDWY